MSFTTANIRHVANLARLTLSPEEEETYRQQLSVILEAFEQLAHIDTAGIEPTSHVMPGAAHIRADVAVEASGATVALSNARTVAGTSFVIPKVLE